MFPLASASLADMETQLFAGKDITVLAYGDERLTRTLVAVEEMHLYVCKREEWEAAERERREPVCIGFRLDDLVH